MSDLQELLQNAVADGATPGVVALVARGGDVEIAAAGVLEVGGSVAVGPDSLFRISSLTKPVVAVLALMLVDEGRIGLDDPIGEWLPELAHPQVVRTPDGPLDDLVQARRPITVADLLTSRAGWGFPDDFTWPGVGALLQQGSQGFALKPQLVPPPDEWVENLSRVPLLYQPGERWLYNTCSDILGVLLARATDTKLPELLAERVFGPLGMTDTGFSARRDQWDRFTTFYHPADDGFTLGDAPIRQWSRPPLFPSGSGGLVSTLDDYYAFARTLLPGPSGAPTAAAVLSPESLTMLLTDHLTAEQRDGARLFLEGQGWGVGGSVDVTETEPWNVLGRYGWSGGTGTTAHIIPATGTVAILLSTTAMMEPEPVPLQKAFWTYAARRP